MKPTCNGYGIFILALWKCQRVGEHGSGVSMTLQLRIGLQDSQVEICRGCHVRQVKYEDFNMPFFTTRTIFFRDHAHYVRACVCVCVRARVRARVRVCVCASMYRVRLYYQNLRLILT